MSARDDEEAGNEAAEEDESRDSAERLSLSDADVETSPSELPEMESSELESEPAPAPAPPPPQKGGWRKKGKGTGGGWRSGPRAPAAPPRIAPAIRSAKAGATPAKVAEEAPAPAAKAVNGTPAPTPAPTTAAPLEPTGFDVDLDADDTTPGLAVAPDAAPTPDASSTAAADDAAADDTTADDDTADDTAPLAAETTVIATFPQPTATADDDATVDESRVDRADDSADDDATVDESEGEETARTVTAAHMASLVAGHAKAATSTPAVTPSIAKAARKKPTTPPPPPAAALGQLTNPPPQLRDPEAEAMLAAPTNPPPPFEGDSERPLPGVPKAPKMPTESIVVDPEYRRESERPQAAMLAEVAARVASEAPWSQPPPSGSAPATTPSPAPVIEPPEPLELTTVPPSEVPAAPGRSRLPAMIVIGLLLVGAVVVIGGQLGKKDQPPVPSVGDASGETTTSEGTSESESGDAPEAEAPPEGEAAAPVRTPPVVLTLRGVGPDDVVRVDGVRVAVTEGGEIDFPSDPERHLLTVELGEGETWERTLSADSPLTLLVRDAPPPPPVAQPAMRPVPRAAPRPVPSTTMRAPRPRMVVRGPPPRTTGPIRSPGF